VKIKHLTCMSVMFVVLIAIAGCNNGGGGSPPLVRGTVSGKVVSTATGEGIPGASIRAGDASTISAMDGTYTLTPLVAERVVIHIDAAGFAETFQVTRVMTEETAFLDVKLLLIGVSEVVDVASGGTVTIPNSSGQISIPAGGLVPMGGGAASANVNVALTAINPAIDPDVMPGDFTAILAGDSVPVAIESFGALRVDVRDDNGERYTLVAEQSASIRIPVGTLSDSPPATIPLLIFNETTGLWVEEGVATLAGSAPDQFYVGTIQRFGAWNADRPLDTIFVSGCVRDTANQIVSNVRVSTKGINYSGTASDFTNAEGNFRVAMRRVGLATLSVTFLDVDGKLVTTSINVGPFAENVTLEDCIVTEPVPLQITARSLPGAGVDRAYSATFTATNGTPPYDWQVISGNLPPGLTLNSATGLISGIPTEAGFFTGTIQVQDSSVPPQSAETSFFISVTAAPAFEIATRSLPSGIVDTVYNASLIALNGTLPYDWSLLSGDLPAGLTLSTNGQISGTPTVAGTFNLTIQVQDSATPPQMLESPFTLIISSPNTSVLTVTISGNGSGTITSDLNGFSCGFGCTEYPTDTVVTLTATALEGSKFTGWSGDCTGIGSCIVTMDSNKSVTASFTPDLGLNVILADPAYTVLGMTSRVSLGVPGNLGAIMFSSDASTLNIVGASEASSAALYSVPLTRDTNNRVNTLGTGSLVFSASDISAGLSVKPGTETLFFTRYSNNVLSQRVGDTITDYPLAGLGIPTSVGAAIFAPSTLPNTGDLLLSTYSSGQVFTVALTDNGNGTFTPDTATLFVDLPNGAGGGISYIPSGTYEGDLIYVNWSNGTIDIVDIDPSTGFPIDAVTNQATLGTTNPKITPFASGLGRGPWGLTFDPISNDLFLTTWGGAPSNTLIQITGFPSLP